MNRKLKIKKKIFGTKVKNTITSNNRVKEGNVNEC